MKKVDRKKSDRKKRWRYLLGNFHFRNLKKFITQPIPSFTVFFLFYGLNPLDRKKVTVKKVTVKEGDGVLPYTFIP